MTSRISILIIMEPLIGGTLKHLESLVYGLDKRQFELTLAVSFVRDETVRAKSARWADAGVRIVEIPMVRNPSPKHDLRALSAIVRLLNSRDFDLVHTHSSKGGFLGRLAVRLSGFRGGVVHTPHVFPFQQPVSDAVRRLYVMLERTALAWTDSIVVLTQYQRLLAIRELHAGPGQLERIPNGVDLDQFRPSSRLAARRELRIPEDAVVISFVGRPALQKGLDILDSAVEKLLCKGGDATDILILHAGSPVRASGSTDARYERLGTKGHIRSLGILADVRPVYAASDIVAAPSRWEGMPYSVLEAMAMARPVITTSVCGLHEIIENGRTGILVPPDDADSLAEAIHLLLRNKGLSGRIGKAAECSARRWPVENTLEAATRTYKRLAGNRA